MERWKNSSYCVLDRLSWQISVYLMTNMGYSKKESITLKYIVELYSSGFVYLHTHTCYTSRLVWPLAFTSMKTNISIAVFHKTRDLHSTHEFVMCLPQNQVWLDSEVCGSLQWQPNDIDLSRTPCSDLPSVPAEPPYHLCLPQQPISQTAQI